MPKSAKKSRSSSSSSSSRSSSRSSQKKDKCKDDKCKPLDCRATVPADLDVWPLVRVPEKITKTAGYDIPVKIKVTPDCCIKEVKSRPVSKCEIECLLRVGLTADYNIEATPCNGTSFDRVEIPVCVENKYAVRCAK